MTRGTLRGTVVEYYRLFEDELNKKLAAENKLKNKNLKVRGVLHPVRRDQLLPALAAGKGDIVSANLTITPERQKLVDFTTASLSQRERGRRVGACFAEDRQPGRSLRQGSVRAQVVELLREPRCPQQKFAAAKKPPVKLKEAPETLEDEDLLEMLDAGLVALVIVDKHKADFWKQIFTKLTVHDNVAVRSGGGVGPAIRKGSPQLKAALDEFIARHKVGTATGNQLLTRYLKNVKYVKNAASEEERKKFLALIQYFQKYGEQYDVDWVLMGAQGYQESQLNQNAKSPVGAIGVMQVMPATGKDMKVGDITRDRGEHPRRHQVHALDDRPVLRQGADDEARQGAVRVRLLQCRRGPHFVSCARRPPSADSTPTSGFRTWSTWRPRRSARKR